MRIEDFDQAAAMGAAICPRCHAVGLVEIDYDIYATAAAADRHLAAYLIDPSVPARCPACALVMEWHAALHESPL